MNILFTGQRGSGKSTFLYELTAYLDMACGGIISLPVMQDGEKVGMDALDVATDRRVPLARLHGDGIPVGHYRLRREGIAHARRAIYRGALTRHLTVIDEVGPLELRGGGLMPAVRFALEHAPHVVVVVRRRLADAVAAMPWHFYRATEPDQLERMLLPHIANYNSRLPI